MEAILVPIYLMLILFLVLTLLKQSLELYFMGFDLNKHPHLINIVDTVLSKIAKKEDVEVFKLSHKELNENVSDIESKACGLYVYINKDMDKDGTYAKKMKDAYLDILRMEKHYNKPYKEIYREVKKEETNIIPHKLCYPRIEIATNDNVSGWETLYYYKVFAHELGHHFAITLEDDHTEKRGNEIGAELIYNNTPKYFRLIFGYLYDIVFDDEENRKKYGKPNTIKFLKLLWLYYWNYYHKKK